jgi:hypothetical protein
MPIVTPLSAKVIPVSVIAKPTFVAEVAMAVIDAFLVEASTTPYRPAIIAAEQ